MVRIFRHVAANVKLLAKCSELDTKLSRYSRSSTRFSKAKSRNGSGLPVSIEGTLMDAFQPFNRLCNTWTVIFPRIQHTKTVVNVPKETLESTRILPHVGVQHIQIQIGQFACTLKTGGQAPCDLEKGSSVLRELCRQDKVQLPHKKLDQVWFK